MVGIIVVSHSWKLANEIIHFCNEMKKGSFEIVNASGLDENTFGSNPLNIQQAIEQVYSKNKDGVFIFCDIGSSILSSKMAIDLLDDNNFDKSKIIIADAPIVEGTFIATTLNQDNAFELILNELKLLKQVDKTQ